ncbi:MAG: ABC transporter ATP-binding protein [Candidatus Magasanikbacteria bacterium]|nr:ABC transporter ATP-binding protein [Candidatus Magasanikbacteria bacterium]
MALIEVTNLTKTYEYYKKDAGLAATFKSLFHREKLFTNAVNDVSFSIEEGEFVGFLGPNGAGKTTTLKILSGILHPTSGDAHVLGFRPWERHAEFQKQFAIVMGQKNQLWWDLPAVDSFVLNKEIYEVSDHAYKLRLDELTDLLDISDIIDRPVRKLSLGQRMKAELIAALIHNPRVLFLDEPTIGLDVVSQQKIREFLKKYNEEKKTTIILTSHYMEDVTALTKRVIMIDHGKKMYDGPLADMMAKYVDHKILDVTFNKAVFKKDLRPLGDIVEHEPHHVLLSVLKKDIPETAAAILKNFPVEDISISEESLESVVRKMFDRPKN